MKPVPPITALKFLRWFCREDYLEEIEGDLTELYEKRYDQSPAKAKWKFTWNVIRYLRPGFVKSFKTGYNPNTIATFRHNFLLTYRNFKRYKSSFFINLIGLSSGLACALLIYLWVNDELSIDHFYEYDSQLFQVMEHYDQAHGIWTSSSTAGPMAAALISEMPEVEYAAVTGQFKENVNLSVDDKNIRANGNYISNDYLKMFSYNIVQGDKNRTLPDKNSIAVSQGLAMKLFSTTENIIGKAIRFQHDKQFFISAIFETPPFNASERCDFVLPYEVFEEMYPSVLEWQNASNRVYLILQKGANIEEFNNKIAGYIKAKTNNQVSFRTPFVKRYTEKYLYGNYKNGIQTGGRIEYVRLFSIIAIFILVIACINFMNLSTAKASRRLKEVGIKKAVGAGRKSLILQYLSESQMMTFLSLMLSVTLVFLFLPQFNEITGKHLVLSFDLPLILLLLGITLFTGLVSGSYPAFYLSGFNPVAVLKSKINIASGGLLARKGLVVFQFAISVILIVAVFVIFKQIEFIQTKDLGYNKDNILWFKKEGKLLDDESLDTFLSGIRGHPGVVNASSIRHDFAGHVWGGGGLSWEGKGPEDQTQFQIIPVGYDMIEILDMEIVSGRTFSREISSDWKNLIFNEAAIDYMGLQDPVGKYIKGWGFDDRQIIGVVKDFHFESLHENIKPVVMLLANSRAKADRVMIKLDEGREQETINSIRKFYQSYNPGFSFDYKFLDQGYQAQYVAEQRVATLSRYFAALAILISCLGLFGLTAFTAEQRLKEIGIRKILGSSAFEIVGLLSGDFTKMVLIAIVIALPMSYFIAAKWLEGFAYGIDLELWFFISAGLVALFIAWFTIAVHTVKAANVNPVACLKDE